MIKLRGFSGPASHSPLFLLVYLQGSLLLSFLSPCFRPPPVPPDQIRHGFTFVAPGPRFLETPLVPASSTPPSSDCPVGVDFRVSVAGQALTLSHEKRIVSASRLNPHVFLFARPRAICRCCALLRFFKTHRQLLERPLIFRPLA